MAVSGSEIYPQTFVVTGSEIYLHPLYWRRVVVKVKPPIAGHGSESLTFLPHRPGLHNTAHSNISPVLEQSVSVTSTPQPLGLHTGHQGV